MPTLCIQCSLKALLAGCVEPPLFAEEPADHIRLHHSDLAQTEADRKRLEKELAVRFERGDFSRNH